MYKELYSILPFKKILGEKVANNFIDSPCFVVGCGRSGTTALCRALSEHPAILMSRPEAPLHHHIGEIAYEYQYGRIKKYYQYSTKIPVKEFYYNLKKLCFDSVWGEDSALRYSLKKSIQGSSLKIIKYWGSKSFPNENESMGLNWLFPNLKFVYIFRNGIEVVHSMTKFDAFDGLSFEEKCEFWASRIFRYKYLLNDKRSISIRFEDFVNNPEGVLRVVFSHLGLQFDENSVRFLKENVVHPLDQKDQPVDPQKIFKERTEPYKNWTDIQKNTFKATCTKAMIEAGYEIPF